MGFLSNQRYSTLTKIIYKEMNISFHFKQNLKTE